MNTKLGSDFLWNILGWQTVDSGKKKYIEEINGNFQHTRNIHYTRTF